MGTVEISARELAFGAWQTAIVKPGGGSAGAFSFDQVIPLFDPLPVRQSPMIPKGLKMSISAQKLARMDGPGKKTDPFFRVIDDHQRTIYRSEVVKQTLDPVWADCRVPLDFVKSEDTPSRLKCTIGTPTALTIRWANFR